MAQNAAWWANSFSAPRITQDLGSILMPEDLPWPPCLYMGLGRAAPLRFRRCNALMTLVALADTRG